MISRTNSPQLLSVLFLLVISIFPACSRTPFIQPFDSASYQELDDEAARKILSSLVISAQQLRSYRSLVHVDLKRHDYREEFDQVVVFERPAKLRLEILSRELRRTLKLIIVDGKDISVFDRERMEVLKGESTPASIQKLIGLPLSAEELMLVLAGQVNPFLRGKILRAEAFTARNSGMTALVMHYDSGQFLRLSFVGEGPAARIVRVDLGEGRDNILLRADYHYAQNLKTLPSSMSLWIESEEVLLNLEFDKPELNPDLSRLKERIFSFTPPAGTKVKGL